LGDVFLAGYTFKGRSLAEISRQFGDGFTQRFSVNAERLGQWVGPLQSIFGNHWVWVEDIAESRVKRFDEVAQDVATRHPARSRQRNDRKLGECDACRLRGAAVRRCLSVLLLLVTPLIAEAHRFAPSALDVRASV